MNEFKLKAELEELKKEVVELRAFKTHTVKARAASVGYHLEQMTYILRHFDSLRRDWEKRTVLGFIDKLKELQTLLLECRASGRLPGDLDLKIRRALN